MPPSSRVHSRTAARAHARAAVAKSIEEMMEDVHILNPIGAGAFAVVYRGTYGAWVRHC
jgi:hypothetical protein